jgi:hypothetical protein
MANFILPYEPQYKRHRKTEKPANGAPQLYERTAASPSIVPQQIPEKAEMAGAPRAGKADQ